ncbi:MAG: YitT family protein [Clostridia bacterium]|nr:YitT family protein [Clostridia bacterium]MBQ4341973.1 YitT family protein [Clostridia bacterium]
METKDTRRRGYHPFNPYNKNFDPLHDAITLLIIAGVCFMQCCVLSYFYVPFHFLSGGVTGLSLLFNYIWGIPRFVVLLGLNIPIAIYGIKQQGWKFTLFSLFATLCYSLMFELPLMDKITAASNLGDNALLSAIVGSAIVGVTNAFVVKRGATVGGIDVITVVLSHKLSIPAGSFNIVFNIIIMSFLIPSYGIEVALMSMVSMFITNTAYNFALRGVNHNMTVFIISEQWDEIAPQIMQEMRRGVTYIHAEGAYTGQPRTLVYCIVKTTELAKLKKIVKDHDPKALFSVIETQDVVGRGFGAIN